MRTRSLFKWSIIRKWIKVLHNNGSISFSFRKNFRLSKASFLTVYNDLAGRFPVPLRDTFVRPILRLSLVLRFLAHGDYQVSVGNNIVAPVAQSTVSNILKEMLPIMETVLCPKWIEIRLTAEECQESMDYFEQRYGLSGVVGCIDGSHVLIKNPGQENYEALYVNRKSTHSLNVMVISDWKCRIRAINPRFPGSNHDAFVYRSSAANQYFRENQGNLNNMWILGKYVVNLNAFQGEV